LDRRDRKRTVVVYRKTTRPNNATVRIP